MPTTDKAREVSVKVRTCAEYGKEWRDVKITIR